MEKTIYELAGEGDPKNTEEFLSYLVEKGLITEEQKEEALLNKYIKIEDEIIYIIDEEHILMYSPDLTGFNVDTTYYLTYNSEGEEIRTPITEDVPFDWYSYTEEDKKWANIVTENNGGQVYLVWIPRYIYIIEESEIVIKFCNTENQYYNNGIQEMNDNYNIPEAFRLNLDNDENIKPEEITGFWVSKYAIGLVPDTDTYQAAPGISTYRYATANDFFVNSRMMETSGGTLGLNASITVDENGIVTETGSNNIDSHMIKNTEWGAIVMLSGSKYGIGLENSVNNSMNGLYYEDTASTTYNSYGVYGMTNGHRAEYVATTIIGVELYTGLNEYLGIADYRYVDRYQNIQEGQTIADIYITGDATYETYIYGKSSSASAIHDDIAIFKRGWWSIFSFGSHYGTGDGWAGSRIAIWNGTNI